MSSRISGQKINYSVRPGKSIERKMIRDILSRLFVFYPLKEYQYIGFGSKYFTDFTLFHKSINLKKMISLEQDIENSERYNFNKPFQCIEICFERSSEWLMAKEGINEPSIVWFDYDGSFDQTMVDDCCNLARKLNSGSVFALSFNYTAPKEEQLSRKFPDTTVNPYLQWFEELFGTSHIDPTMDTRGLSDKFKFLKRLIPILESVLDKVISERNEFIEDTNEKFLIKPLFSFTYRDGAPMATIGWILIHNKHFANYELMKLGEFEFCSENMEEPYDIDPANLTIREIRYLSEIVSNLDGELDDDQIKYFTNDEISSFKKLYKYFPAFTEIEAY
ncbi:hypothetical protein L291_2664 [Acinetobacter guillouiae MSP4-18]|uniref:O-methyltransferase n=1 Tax=Acinetobacter guillouiae TaxID=106649 RepID=UPI0002CD8563|nr:O-methyltransferase [Acinetobacter guillouiae]ENU60078.1 hypothetical protein F981_01052 [Acinetobacter guillouiae CIP 63.46]EPH38564.1 hypothetical protein L291_2664 [Acinetobacter guillouiae MSP4-18]KAB0629478.1 hypothetical protein F7P82_04440 [Acinetobacter guillouiae]